MDLVSQDIIDSIIEKIDDRVLLKTCTLVSPTFLIPSRKRLFSRIFLKSDQTCQRLHQLLVENPVLQSFVKSIIMDLGDKTLRLNGTSLVAILRLPFCCLESSSIHTRYQSDWEDFGSELKDALSTIIHSPTLKTLQLDDILNVPTMLFQGIHLTTLILSNFFPNESNGERSVSPRQTVSEGAVATTASHMVVDRCKWSFSSALGMRDFLSHICFISY